MESARRGIVEKVADALAGRREPRGRHVMRRWKWRQPIGHSLRNGSLAAHRGHVDIGHFITS